MPSADAPEEPSAAQGQSAQWDFIVSLYAKPDVRDACLTLQNMGGVDVPVLLAVAYATATQNIAPDLQDIREMDVLVDPLRKGYVLPLRAMRTALKSAATGSRLTALRAKILEVELLAEREQLALLDRHFSLKTPLSTGLAIDDTLRVVCDFYFDKGHVDQDAARKMMPSLAAISKAVASVQ